MAKLYREFTTQAQIDAQYDVEQSVPDFTVYARHYTDESRVARHRLRCELDAAYFHLYGIARADVDYILDTFPIVKRKDEAQHGEYRTKRVILEIYDEMEQAKRTSRAYQTRLDPPPGDPRAAHQAVSPGRDISVQGPLPREG